MQGFLEIGLVVSAILMLLAVNFLLWLTVALGLLGLLGWHPPGWIASPAAHGVNIGFAIVGTVVSLALPIVIELTIKKIVTSGIF